MKSFFNKHPEAILAAIGLLIVAGIIGLYVWGVSDVAFTTNRALNYVPPQNAVGFDIADAMKLDWRGLIQ